MTPRGSETRVDEATPFSSVVQTQEELLRRGLPAVHLAVLAGTVLSVGVGVPWDAPFVRRANALGIPTARRSSGGTGILHREHDLVWAIVLPRSDPRVGREFVRGYARYGAGLVSVLAGHGASASWVPAPGLSEDYCPLSSRGYVLELGGVVVGAAAQHLTATALLHHGALSLSVDRDLVSRLFSFPDPSIVERLGGLDERGLRERPGRLADEVARALAAELAAV